MAHRNARLNVFGRELLCRRIAEEGWTVIAAASAAGVSRTTATKWIRRYRLEGSAGLADRSSRPRRLAGLRARLRKPTGTHTAVGSRHLQAFRLLPVLVLRHGRDAIRCFPEPAWHPVGVLSARY